MSGTDACVVPCVDRHNQGFHEQVKDLKIAQLFFFYHKCFCYFATKWCN